MSRADEPAYPVPVYRDEAKGGLTIREHFAAMAMQGLLAKYSINNPVGFEIISQAAVRQADALIAELVKVQP